jgi:E3 ubiquitin-protein ligase listerin
MCHLLTDPSVSVQKMAYQLLQQAAKKRAEYVAIEAAVNPDSSNNPASADDDGEGNGFKAQLPPELLDILQWRLERDSFGGHGNGEESWGLLEPVSGFVVPLV